jgi:hypothetical protein
MYGKFVFFRSVIVSSGATNGEREVVSRKSALKSQNPIESATSPSLWALVSTQV